MEQKKLYCWAACMQTYDNGKITTSVVQGYNRDFSNENECRGYAYERAKEMKPGFNVLEILVLEIPDTTEQSR